MGDKMSTNLRKMHLNIAASLRESIRSGRYQPGDTLPPEIQLADQFNVSRGTMRKAMKVLVDENSLVRIAGKGTFVNAPAALGQVNAQRTNLLGIVLPHIHDPLSTNLINGAEQTARQNGYNLIFCNLDENLETEKEQFARLVANHVSGVILFPLAVPGELELVKELAATQISLVLVDRQITGFPAPTVMVDNFGGAYQAVQHLLSLGHRRIACITHPEPASSVTQRIQGYDQAMRDANLLPYSAISLSGVGKSTGSGEPPTYSPEELHWVEHMLSVSNRPTAVFCINDYLAMGVMRLALTKGLRIPEDLAVVGFDNNPFAQLAPVPLTTIAQPSVEVGAQAGRVLLNLIAGKDTGNPERLLLPTQLIVRASSASSPSS